MILVHMGDDAGFGRRQRLGPFERHQEIARFQIDDAPETANVVSAFHREPPEGEVREVGVEPRFRVTGEEAALDRLAVNLFGPAMEGHAGALQGIGEVAGAIDQDRSARISAQIGRVARQGGNQEDRGAAKVRGDGDEGRVRGARRAVEGRQGGLEGSSCELASIRRDLDLLR